jgi:aminoacrylate hydrolase
LLARHRRLILPDNRGSGRTRHRGPIRPADWVDDCVAVLDHAGIGQAQVLGHSLGGMIALRLALRAPDRVERLVLAATAASSDARSLALMRDLAAIYERIDDAGLWFRLLFQWLFAPSFFDDPQRVAEAARMAAGYEHVQSPADFRRQVEALALLGECDPAAFGARAMLIVGGEDIMIPSSLSRSSLAGLRRLRTEGLAGAAHSLHWDRPEAFAAAVIDFLGDSGTENA